LKLVDIDGDSDLDIVGYNSTSTKLVWYANDVENFVIPNPPVAVDDIFTMYDGTTLTIPAPGVLANDTDPDNDTLFLNGKIGEAASGAFEFNGVDGGFTYIPNPSFSGIDSIRYEISDGLEVDQATVYIEVIALPTPPYQIDEQINKSGSFKEFDLGRVSSLPLFTLNNAFGADASYEIITDSQDGDSKALKIDFGAFNDRVSPDDEWHVEIAAEALRVQEGDTYEASVWLKADTNARLAAFYFGLPAAGNWGRYAETHVTLTTEWTNYKVQHTADATGEEIGIRFGTLFNFAPNDSAILYYDNLSITKVIPTSSERLQDNPVQYSLSQNYPNPFNPSTRINFELPNSSQVQLKVYDMTGRIVATLINNEMMTSGAHSIKFDAKNLSSGVYFYSLQTQEGFNAIKKMTLIK
ncbi:MAG: Ig-like domain-containing protein, partial [Balneolaceae bacterium]